jgi:hypothetical protein
MDATLIATSIDRINREYARLHTAKEDAFWNAYMGLDADAGRARAALSEAEVALHQFLSDPARLASVREWTRAAEALLDLSDTRAHPSEEDFVALSGWMATLEAHVIENPQARLLAEELIEQEGRLALARGKLELWSEDAHGVRQPASSVRLSALLANDPSERVRRSAWHGLRSIEPHLLEHGFLELVKLRNRFGRLTGGEDWYDSKVRRVEGLTKQEIFAWLEELEQRTRVRAEASLEELRAKKGAEALLPWNTRFASSGDIALLQDPHFPFGKALERWMRSFGALGIRYRGATLVLDLVDRPGKYENGFMHGPVPAWVDRGRWIPARIQFTANAIPGLPGAGRRATDTLFHEGGHAAHFANIVMPSPCFAQEFAPMSVGHAETQSMLLESLLEDPLWQRRHARTNASEAMSEELILQGIAVRQPMAAWSLRSMLSVCFAERALYEIPDQELSAARVLEELRAVERRLLLLEQGSPRPVLSVPHLASNESSAYYHGYVLADMALEQTSQFFRRRDGSLVDNPRVGPDLAEHYWRSGNQLPFRALVENLTGADLGAEALGLRVSRDAAQAQAEARAVLNDAAPAASGDFPALEARIRVVHGHETIGEAGDGELDRLCAQFESWIDARQRG